MSFDFTLSDLQRAIAQLSLPRNASVLTSTAFYRLGRLKDVNESQYYDSLGHAITDCFGSERTLLVHAFTNFVGRYGHPFVAEDSLTSTSKFDQWVLRQPGCVRSLHPLHSIAALGPEAQAIGTLKRHTNYGMGSAFDQFMQTENPYILRIGIDPYHNSLAHHAEALVNVPYCYQKLLTSRVIHKGQEIPGPWYAYVRYLHLKIKDDYTVLKSPVTQAGLIQSHKVGRGFVHLLDAKKYLNFILEKLIENPFFLLAEVPQFPQGVIPFDGLTFEREQAVVDITNSRKPPTENSPDFAPAVSKVTPSSLPFQDRAK